MHSLSNFLSIILSAKIRRRWEINRPSLFVGWYNKSDKNFTDSNESFRRPKSDEMRHEMAFVFCRVMKNLTKIKSVFMVFFFRPKSDETKAKISRHCLSGYIINPTKILPILTNHFVVQIRRKWDINWLSWSLGLWKIWRKFNRFFLIVSSAFIRR